MPHPRISPDTCTCAEAMDVMRNCSSPMDNASDRQDPEPVAAAAAAGDDDAVAGGVLETDDADAAAFAAGAWNGPVRSAASPPTVEGTGAGMGGSFFVPCLTPPDGAAVAVCRAAGVVGWPGGEDATDDDAEDAADDDDEDTGASITAAAAERPPP